MNISEIAHEYIRNCFSRNQITKMRLKRIFVIWFLKCYPWIYPRCHEYIRYFIKNMFSRIGSKSNLPTSTYAKLSRNVDSDPMENLPKKLKPPKIIIISLTPIPFRGQLCTKNSIWSLCRMPACCGYRPYGFDEFSLAVVMFSHFSQMNEWRCWTYS